MNKNPEPARKLGEILMEKLTEKRTEIETQLSDAGEYIFVRLLSSLLYYFVNN